jgi:diguanylate cyclase (GGDEF)-like protein
VADDSVIARRIVKDLLTAWGYDVVACNDGDQAWAELSKDDPPVLAILDWEMPGVEGVEICRRVRALGREPYIYVILLTANERKEAVVEGLAAGADDYVRKPFDKHELEVRLRAGKRVTDLQSELIAARESLRAQATHDPLTGLWNRRAILDLLEKELARNRREGTSLAALVIDLDHFKKINDTHGHLVGDTVLLEAAKRMRSVLRSYDAVGRYGGEEFLIVLTGCTKEIAARRADQVRDAIGSEPMLVGKPITVTGSVGVAVAPGDAEVDPRELLAAADEALYRAKNAGRNRIAVA